MPELHRPIEQATIVYCDNISAIYMSGNPVQHRRTKHIEIDIHVRVLHVPTSAQFADIFTKGLATTPFQDIRFSQRRRAYCWHCGEMLEYNLY